MIYTVKEFCDYVSLDVKGFMETVRGETSRQMTDNEMRENSASYQEVSKMFALAMKKNPRFGDVNISTTNMLLEYQLPGASAWCDLVLIGKGETQNQVVILELKNYRSDDTDVPSEYEGLIIHNNREQQHPSEQVKGYTDYCQNFHSTVVETDAQVSGCVFIASTLSIKPFKESPNDNLTSEYPVFNTEGVEDLADFILKRVKQPDKDFATKFVDGFYKQNRNILTQVANTLNTTRMYEEARPFVLLDEQQAGFLQAKEALEKAIRTGKKSVIIIQGPPGSGKSAIAINLWIEAAMKYPYGNVVYVTTGASQNSNWEQIFKNYARQRGAEGFLYKSTKYNPGLQGGSKDEILQPLIDEHPEYMFTKQNGEKTHRYDCFREYLAFMQENGLTKNYKSNLHYLSVVDEAHALINPLVKNYSANNMAGWCLQAGPQAWHIINESLVSVFLTDTKQSFRDNETTSIEDIKDWAREFGIDPIIVTLDGLQFRCSGSLDYVEWVNNLFTYHPVKNHSKWQEKFKFKVYDYPSDVDAFLRARSIEGSRNYVRVLSSYSREWVTKGKIPTPMSGKPDDVPFDFDLEDKGGRRYQKVWNVTHKSYIQAPQNSKMYYDPLCEVGCPYTVRGFDYEYVGILWLDDIVRRGDKWVINYKNAVETGLQSKRNAAFKEQCAINDRLPKSRSLPHSEIRQMIVEDDGSTPAIETFFEKIAQAYRILFTRGIRGVCLYVQDRETREYVRSLL